MNVILLVGFLTCVLSQKLHRACLGSNDDKKGESPHCRGSTFENTKTKHSTLENSDEEDGVVSEDNTKRGANSNGGAGTVHSGCLSFWILLGVCKMTSLQNASEIYKCKEI